MIDSVHHIELDGTKYRLAESAEGSHHAVRGEPLRPPNAVTVQGESSQEFQPRADMLLWNWSDWSQGEGKRKLKFGEGGRSWQLNGMRAFEEPGHLIPGYYVEVTKDSGGTNPRAHSLALVVGMDTLYGLDTNAANVYTWDGTKWDAGASLSGVTSGASDTAVGDRDNIYWIERGTNNVWKWSGSGSPTKISNSTIPTSNTAIAQTADYVYVYHPETAKVYEIPKTGATDGVEIDSWTEGGNYPEGRNCITELDGKIYVMVTSKTKTAVREITPSSAAGTGFGAEVSTYHGFEGDAMWAHSGSLFTVGRYQTAEDNRTVLWDTPNGERGSLGEVREDEIMLTASGGSGRMLDHFWVQEQLNGTQTNHALMQVDSVTGGMSCVAYDEVGDANGEDPQAVVAFDGDVFWSTRHDATTKRIMRARIDQYTISSSAISPEHDFDLASQKYLGSMVLSVEPLPADWTVYLDYQIDNNGTWTNAITYTTDGGTGETVAVSTDSATVEFRILQMRLRAIYTGAGVPTSAPVILAAEARAAVTEKVMVFELLVDLSDDHSAGGQSYDGASKVDNFTASAAKTTVLDFKDGYTTRAVNSYDQYDVVVDSYTVVLDRPGEGIGVLSLRETV